VVQAFDFRPGSDFVHEMQQATASAGQPHCRPRRGRA